ncbi:MFS transporter [Saccharomonospora iraqiensis]|uniref:MFS transporter n=1 Tax=Saccharomonospora iraqiensis TaxID=52698 RepID=UPI00047C9C8D|nr:MFS transporter [Saccharomonospora iraqiensis]
MARTGTWALAGAGLALIATCYGLARFAYGLFVPAFRDAFGIGAAMAGVLGSMSYAAYCVGILVSTLASPRWGSRRVAVAAGSLATVGTALVALAPHEMMLGIGVVIAGASTGVASPPLAQAVSRAASPGRRDRIQTVINAGTGLGVVVSGPIALSARDQWRLAWLVFAVLCALVTLWNARVIPSASRPGVSAAGVLPRPLFPEGAVRLLFAALLTGAASSATWVFGRDLLVSSGGLGDRESTTGWILLGAFGLVGAFAGDLVRSVGLRLAWPVTMLAMALATALLAALPGVLGVAWVSMATFGAAYIALTGMLLIWGTRVYARSPAAGVGFAFLIIAAGQTVAAPLIGVLSDAVGPSVAFGAAALLALGTMVLRPPRASVAEVAVRPN